MRGFRGSGAFCRISRLGGFCGFRRVSRVSRLSRLSRLGGFCWLSRIRRLGRIRRIRGNGATFACGGGFHDDPAKLRQIIFHPGVGLVLPHDGGETGYIGHIAFHIAGGNAGSTQQNRGGGGKVDTVAGVTFFQKPKSEILVFFRHGRGVQIIGGAMADIIADQLSCLQNGHLIVDPQRFQNSGSFVIGFVGEGSLIPMPINGADRLVAVGIPQVLPVGAQRVKCVRIELQLIGIVQVALGEGIVAGVGIIGRIIMRIRRRGLDGQ